MRQQPQEIEVAYRNAGSRIRVVFHIPAINAKEARAKAEAEKRNLAAYRHIGTN